METSTKVIMQLESWLDWWIIAAGLLANSCSVRDASKVQ